MLGVDEGYHHILISQNHLDRKMPLISGQKPATGTMLACSCIPSLFVQKTNPNKQTVNKPLVKLTLLTHAGKTLLVPCQWNCSLQEQCLILDTWWLRFGSRSCQICQGNIRGAVFSPWLSEHFFASLNFIMKAWIATNSQLGTKPVWWLPLSTRPGPIGHSFFRFARYHNYAC